MQETMKAMQEELRLLKKHIFGASSEKLPREDVEGQMDLLFNEAELYADFSAPEVEEQPAAARTRKRRSGSVCDVIPENTPVEIVEHRLSEDELYCPECGTTMVEIGKEIHRELKIIPARVIVREDHYYSYACAVCKDEAEKTPILTAPRKPAVIPGSFASPEAIAHIMNQKYVMASPLSRQAKAFERDGIQLSKQTMSNWILRAEQDWLRPVYEHLHEELCKSSVLHADETTLQVLHEEGKTAQSKSYMWLYRTSGDSEFPIILYDYQPNRKGVNAENFLKGFSGYLHTDGFAGYHKLREDIRIVGCWAHARRKLDDAVKALPKGEQATAAALEGQRYCSKLFAIEGKLADVTPEERYKQRLEQAKPVLDALLAWSHSVKAAPKSALGRAIYYLHEQWPYLLRYLEDGRLELSNNRAEQGMKKFAIGRKNFLFANVPKGAQGSAVIYSIVETAIANNLDPYRYLVWIMQTAPALSKTDPDWAAKLAPNNAPDEVKACSNN